MAWTVTYAAFWRAGGDIMERVTNVPRGIILLVAVGVVAAWASTAGSSSEPAALAPAPSSIATSPTSPATADPAPTNSPTTAPPPATTRPATTPPATTPASAPTSATATSASSATVVAATTTSRPTAPSTAPPAPVSPTEAPSFELGPDVVLDVAASQLPTGWAAFDGSLEASLIRPGNTSAGVAVLIDGDVVHSEAFGVRDPATLDPAGPEDRYRIASISKTITAIVALRLVEDGVVGLDDPVGQLVAEHVGLDGVGASGGLTLRQLLTHRSGFGKYDTAFFRGGAADCADAARQGLLAGVAGGGYTYSNMNYCVAGLAIEALTGLTYEQATYRELLTPLGISGMRLAPTVDPGPDEAQHATTAGRNYMETLGAAGAWIASPSDLVTIMDSLDHSTAGYKPLSEEMVAEMVTPFGGQPGQRGYGYGLISYGGGRVGHTGTIESTHAMLLDRGDGVTWAVTVAGQNPSDSTDLEQIVNAAFTAGGFVAG